jgi:hypothetical protein
MQLHYARDSSEQITRLQNTTAANAISCFRNPCQTRVHDKSVPEQEIRPFRDVLLHISLCWLPPLHFLTMTDGKPVRTAPSCQPALQYADECFYHVICLAVCLLVSRWARSLRLVTPSAGRLGPLLNL